MAKKVAHRPHVHTIHRTPAQKGPDNSTLFYGGIAVLAAVAAGGYFWMQSISTNQQYQQGINAAQTGQQPSASAAASSAGGPGFPGFLPGTAAITAGAVNPLGFFSTIFPFFGGAQTFTLVRRTCDPYLGGVPTASDLASQGIVITSYQVNNTGGPYQPSVCGVPKLSITVGTTDPSSAAKLQALGFLPGGYGGPGLFGLPFLGGGAAPYFNPFPGSLSPTYGGYPGPYPRPPPYGYPFPRPSPFLPFLPRRLRHKYLKRFRHHPHFPHHFRNPFEHRDHDDRRPKPIHVLGFPKHNFVRPVGHVMNFGAGGHEGGGPDHR